MKALRSLLIRVIWSRNCIASPLLKAAISTNLPRSAPRSWATASPAPRASPQPVLPQTVRYPAAKRSLASAADARSFTHSTGNDFGRFCSARCREWFDAGHPAHRPLDTSRLCNLPIGPHGFLISCAGCGIRFDSKGLRCCSTDCERSLGRKRELDAFLKDDPFRGVKRKCVGCGGDIPNWRNGRRVSAATQFCKPVCQRKAAKNAGLASGDQNPVLSVQTAKKCPPNGPSREAA